MPHMDTNSINFCTMPVCAGASAIAWIDFILEQRPELFVENDPSARIVGTRSRDYAPRALPELFEWENEGQTSISVS